jgi:Flp pilus assembly protein TadD
MDTAAILANLDLVVTSDTALAHLAGSMGVEVWIALPYAADWRWFRDRDDSPWYPTVRLFRQDRRGDWQTVFARIAAELALRLCRQNQSAKSWQPSTEARAEFQKGTDLAKAGNHAEAVSRLRAAIAFDDHYAEAHHNLGVVLARTGEHQGAIAAFRRTLEIKPDYGEAAANLGLACLEAGDAAEAVAALRRALRTGRNTPEVYNHFGVALSRIGKTTEAVEAYRTALRLQSDFAPAHINLAHAYLALGRFEEAWIELEWRWSSRASRPYKFKKPRWTGEPLRGRTILVYADESPEDTRQYIKYVAGLRELVARVIVICRPELTGLVSQARGVDAAHPLGNALPDHDLYVPLLSLPWLLSKKTVGQVSNQPI